MFCGVGSRVESIGLRVPLMFGFLHGPLMAYYDGPLSLSNLSGFQEGLLGGSAMHGLLEGLLRCKTDRLHGSSLLGITLKIDGPE